MRIVKHLGLALAVASVFANSQALAWDFVYGYQNVFDANADDYVVGQQNIKKYSEWQSPPFTYWVPSANDVQALLTYRFDFAVSTAAISLKAQTHSSDYPSRGDYGFSSLWGSKDGVSWQLLQDNPIPAPELGVDMLFDQALPSSFLGGNSFWLQVRMQDHNSVVNGQPPSTSWSNAQFSRHWDQTPPGNLFEVDVMLVPEPGSFAVFGLGLAALAILCHCKQALLRAGL